MESCSQHFKPIINSFHPVVFELDVAASSSISTLVTSLQGHCLLDALQSQVCLPRASFHLEFGAVLSFDHMPFNTREQHLRRQYLRHRLLSDRIDIFAPFLQHNLTEGKFKCLLGDENILV